MAINVGAFEDWPVEPGAFDLPIAWIDPAIGLRKIAEALRRGGDPAA